MKKLLTVSLVAVMAVSAAHADIASTNYVDARTTEVSFTDTNYLNAKTGLEAAVKALDAQLGAVTGTAGSAVTSADFEAFKTANTTAIGTAKSEAIADAESKVNALANGAVKTNTEAIAAINNADTGILATAKGYTDTKVQEATEDIKASQDDISAEVAQHEHAIGALDGRVTVLEEVDNFTQAEFATFDTANTAAIATAKSEAIADAEGKVNTLANGAVKANTDAIAALEAVDNFTQAEFATFDTANTAAIATAKSEAIADAESKVNALANGAVKTNTEAIAAINNADTGILATAKGYTDTELGALKGISGVQACTKDTVCSLVIKNGILRWEVVQGLE